MNNFMKKYILTFCLMFICSLSFANFSVTPTVINVSGVPGSSYENAYLVTNKFETPMTFTVTLSNGNCFSENEDVDVNDIVESAMNDAKDVTEKAVDVEESAYDAASGEGEEG